MAFVSTAAAEQVTFPLVVDYPILSAALSRQLDPEPDGAIVLWGAREGCRSLVVRDIRAEHADPGVRVMAAATVHVGMSFFGFCIAPLAWEGSLAVTGKPVVERDWHLRLRDLDADLVGARGMEAFVARRVWRTIKRRVEEELSAFAFDLGPPTGEVRALLRLTAPPERAAPVLAAIDTLRPLGAEATPEGVAVRVALDVPGGASPPSAPEPPLTPDEYARWRAELERWDAFLVFVIKDLGVHDAAVRDELLELLLVNRHRLDALLTAGPERGSDAARELFLSAWKRLREVVRTSAAHGVPEDRALRFVAFLAAGDALAALESAAPALGLELSADGLRRLARVLAPESSDDPLAHSETPDRELRELFDFHEPAAGSPDPPGTWWRLGPRPAFAASDDELRDLGRRLDRWVPAAVELEEYRTRVARLLAILAERTAATNQLAGRFTELYRHLVAATAWQESCWRHFVEREGRVTYLVSRSGDIGIMQINRRVWRGFFDLEKLRWDMIYNAGAGAEILAQLLVRYGAREGDVSLANAARATYAAYNGGPDAYRRYRMARTPPAIRAIDHAFWEKYQAVAAGQAADRVLCVEDWRERSTLNSGSSRVLRPRSAA